MLHQYLEENILKNLTGGKKVTLVINTCRIGGDELTREHSKNNDKSIPCFLEEYSETLEKMLSPSDIEKLKTHLSQNCANISDLYLEVAPLTDTLPGHKEALSFAENIIRNNRGRVVRKIASFFDFTVIPLSVGKDNEHPWIYRDENELSEILVMALKEYDTKLSFEEVNEIISSLGLDSFIVPELLIKQGEVPMLKARFKEWFVKNAKMVIGTRRVVDSDLCLGKKGYYWSNKECNWYEAELRELIVEEGEPGDAEKELYPTISENGITMQTEEPITTEDSDFLVR